MSEFLMPSLGADMESAVLMEWHVKEGDKVSKGDVIAEVETSKGVIEIEVFEDGIVEKLLVEEETECKVGTPLAIINSDANESIEVRVEEKSEPKSEQKEEVIEQKEIEPQAEQKPKIEEQSVKIQSRDVKVSPAARKKAEELGIDLSSITPRNGVIQLAQLEALNPQEIKVAVKDEKPQEKKIESTKAKDGMRQAIAAAMSKSNAEIPHYYLSTAINMTPALEYLEELNKQRDIQDRILPAAMLIRAAVVALQKVPELNGFWQDDELQVSEAIHPGIAIALRKGGLITPALLHADIKNLNDTMESLGDLITRTRASKLRSSELMAQTITITNLGDLGVDSVFGVIYPPQVAVIGFGIIKDAPWAEGDTLSVRKVMQATLAGDHRATDGRIGAKFLDTFNTILQNPKEML
ncbi:dihydrolipoamide acetyltransferase family protein [Sulfurimonas sp. C5]|uniref:dihydrolipoamide acetyltransferase family protein n=1 Tax=Sulfurimonas sp. C5 TaxID=3036947 RepID=UPI0024552BC6|nr:dihydrolipoamide acetyltransferase family protein [Sulfurimonas sp. C5]MDH4943975.1 dihydrolipoamide acetyltransferase family protein [Sulfurimonas sp. C5]